MPLPLMMIWMDTVADHAHPTQSFCMAKPLVLSHLPIGCRYWPDARPILAEVLHGISRRHAMTSHASACHSHARRHGTDRLARDVVLGTEFFYADEESQASRSPHRERPGGVVSRSLPGACHGQEATRPCGSMRRLKRHWVGCWTGVNSFVSMVLGDRGLNGS
jgi:hypothetical protein